MKVIVFDPLYSNVGHFFRYNKYILTLLADMPPIKEIIYISNKDEGRVYEKISKKIRVVSAEDGDQYSRTTAQDSLYQTNGIARIKLYTSQMLSYFYIIKRINGLEGDICFFTNNGMIPFWIAVILKLRKKYVVSVISLKSIYEKHSKKHFFYALYRRFLRRAAYIFVTEEPYKKLLNDLLRIHHVAVLHDRFLRNKDSMSAGDLNIKEDATIKLLSLGTMASAKNPVEFVRLLKGVSETIKSHFKYNIVGKSHDGTGDILDNLITSEPCVNYHNSYISDIEYDVLMLNSDYVVIPYSGEYTNFMTSGVMWDCFEQQKPIICPDNELFRFYVSKYNIGFIYTNDTLDSRLENLIKNKDEIKNLFQQNYKKMYDDYSYANTLESFSTALSDLISDYKSEGRQL
jgi:hypothetical protein